MIMNDFWIFGKVCFNLIGRDRPARAGITTQKRYYYKHSSFLFSSLSRKLTIHRRAWLIFTFLLTTVIQFTFLSAFLSRTREVKQKFPLSISSVTMLRTTWGSLKQIFLLKRILSGFDETSGLTTVSLEVTDQFLIYIIFFSLNKTNRRSNIPSQIGSFMINMSLGKENFMR